MNDVSNTEVNGLINTYKDADGKTVQPTTEQLLRVGELMLNEAIERTTAIDSKATNILGYVGVIFAFILSQDEWLKHLDGLEWYFVFAAAGCGLLAAASAIFAVWIRSFAWLSDSIWFRKDCLGFPDRLARAHLKALHLISTQHRSVNRHKASALVIAQGALGFVSFLLIVVLMTSKLC